MVRTPDPIARILPALEAQTRVLTELRDSMLPLAAAGNAAARVKIPDWFDLLFGEPKNEPKEPALTEDEETVLATSDEVSRCQAELHKAIGMRAKAIRRAMRHGSTLHSLANLLDAHPELVRAWQTVT